MHIRRGVNRAREEWADVERRIRQRMRIYPQKQQVVASIPASLLELEQDMPDVAPAPAERRTPIISIHGQDLNRS
ncbi:MAG TPA: hypothetical protein VGK22_06035 [Candidatus Angelobacter sp.]